MAKLTIVISASLFLLLGPSMVYGQTASSGTSSDSDDSQLTSAVDQALQSLDSNDGTASRSAPTTPPPSTPPPAQSQLFDFKRPTKETRAAQKYADILNQATANLVSSGYGGASGLINNSTAFKLAGIIQQALASRNSYQSNQPSCAIAPGLLGCQNSSCFPQPKCSTTDRYRSITNWCNNLLKPFTGNAMAPLDRLAMPNYADSRGGIRTVSFNGKQIPSPRAVSNAVFQEPTPKYDTQLSQLHMQWGQILAHDVSNLPSSVGNNGASLNCTACNSQTTVSANCAPIAVPANDAYFKGKNCFHFTRTLNAQVGLGQRVPVSANTHFWDASPLYGSNACEASAIRQFSKGLMKTFALNGDTIIPQNASDPNCKSSPQYPCFQAGDFRSTLHPGLLPLHTVLVKMHNKVAGVLLSTNPKWSDEQLYQEARRVVVALYQHVAYNEYLPIVIGKAMMTNFNLQPQASGFTKYDPASPANLLAEFSTAAFRFGHSQARAEFIRMAAGYKQTGSISLGNNTFYADSDYSSGGAASVATGLIGSQTMQADSQFSFPIRNQIFETRGKPGSGVDLPAVNIQRARDVGVAPYAQYRSFAGLPPLNSFDQLTSEGVPSSVVAALKSGYAGVTPQDIDLFVGCLIEKPVASDAIVGPTSARIIGEQFKRMKFGDRFYYEHQGASSGSFSSTELQQIRKMTMAHFLCNGDLILSSDASAKIPQNPFIVKSPQVACSSLAKIDFTVFGK